MTLSEALEAREETYEGWSPELLMDDARDDILRYLNCITDQQELCIADMQAIALLSKAVRNLEHDEDHAPKWAMSYPLIWEKFSALKQAFCAFMEQKAESGDGSAKLSLVFDAHRALVTAVMSMTGVTEQEKAVVLSSIKK